MGRSHEIISRESTKHRAVAGFFGTANDLEEDINSLGYSLVLKMCICISFYHKIHTA